jgi:hypothetical protein
MTVIDTTAAEDYGTAMAELYAMSDAGKALGERIGDAVERLKFEWEERAIRQHGKVILAAISGDLMAWPDCTPDWKDREGAEEDDQT